MKNSKIIIIAASLVLASALALCGCMYLIGEPPEETKEYEPDEMTLPPVIEETPTAQSEMQKKFAAYGREEKGENGECIFYLFTEEQIEESLQMRKDGVRQPLTFDEISFIINDTVRLYREYDQIVMPDFSEHTMGVEVNLYHPTIVTYNKEDWKSLADYADFISNLRNQYYSCECGNAVGYTTVVPYHGDFSEYGDYESAFSAYDAMITQIERVISERLRILDTGILFYCSGYSNSSYVDHKYGILLDGGSNGDYSQYKSVLEDRLRIKNSGNNGTSVDTPYLVGYREYNAYEDITTANIYYVTDGVTNKIFPTAELDAVRPRGPVSLSWTKILQTMGYPKVVWKINFDRWNQTVEMTYSKIGQAAVHQKYSGTYYVKENMIFLKLDDGMQIMIKKDGEKYTFVEAVQKDGMIMGTDGEIVFSFHCDNLLDRVNKNQSLAELFAANKKAKENIITP